MNSIEQEYDSLGTDCCDICFPPSTNEGCFNNKCDCHRIKNINPMKKNPLNYKPRDLEKYPDTNGFKPCPYPELDSGVETPATVDMIVGVGDEKEKH